MLLAGRHRLDEESLGDVGLDTGGEGRQVCDAVALGRTELMLLLAGYMTMQDYGVCIYTFKELRLSR